MATIKAYTDIEQSRKLAEILPLESADMQWIIDDLGEPFPFPVNDKVNENEEPCWSLAALLDALPEIKGCKPIIALDDNYITYPHINDLHTKANNLIDACVDMVIKLHGLNLL